MAQISMWYCILWFAICQIKMPTAGNNLFFCASYEFLCIEKRLLFHNKSKSEKILISPLKWFNAAFCIPSISPFRKVQNYYTNKHCFLRCLQQRIIVLLPLSSLSLSLFLFLFVPVSHFPSLSMYVSIYLSIYLHM